MLESTPEHISNAFKVTHAFLALAVTSANCSTQLFFVDELFYSVNVTAIKISITLFLFRILVRPVHKKILYVALTIGCLFTTALFLQVLFQCRPVPKYWMPELPGSCVNPNITVGFAYGYTAINISTDLVLAIVPIFIVRELQMNRRTKIGASIILTMGAMSVPNPSFSRVFF